MAETFLDSPHFTEAVIGVPYYLNNETYLIAGAPCPPAELSGRRASIHYDGKYAVLTTHRIDRSQLSDDMAPGPCGRILREPVLAEQPRLLRRLGRALMKIHNTFRLTPEGTPNNRTAPGIQMRRVSEIVAERDEDPCSVTKELHAAGFFGRRDFTPYREGSEQAVVPADASNYLMVVTPALPLNTEAGELGRTRIIEMLGTKIEVLGGILTEKQIDPVVRRAPNGGEGEFFMPSAIAVIRQALAELSERPQISISNFWGVPQAPRNESAYNAMLLPPRKELMQLPEVPEGDFTATLAEIAIKFGVSFARTRSILGLMQGGNRLIDNYVREGDSQVDALKRLRRMRVNAATVATISAALDKTRVGKEERMYTVEQIAFLRGIHVAQAAQDLHSAGLLPITGKLEEVRFTETQLPKVLEKIKDTQA